MSNPFKAGMHDGRPMYDTDADSRIRAVSRFDRKQCEAAVRVAGLQKTVARAVQARLRYLDKVVVRLHFEDHGQDFLWWDLDQSGKVIGVNLQQFAWIGCKVLGSHTLRKGSIVHYERDGTGHNIRYPLTKVERFKPSVGKS